MIIDSQVKGGKHDFLNTVNFDSEETCGLYFERVKSLFYDINAWDLLFGNKTSFQLTDFNGNHKSEEPTVGDLVKISMPGPANSSGDGFDWVEIKDIETHLKATSVVCCMVVSPCQNPGRPGKTAHFFCPVAKNYFFIRKDSRGITAGVHGRNEVTNFKDLTFANKSRNLLVSKGSILGFSKIQWKSWTKNILDEAVINQYCKPNFKNKF